MELPNSPHNPRPSKSAGNEERATRGSYVMRASPWNKMLDRIEEDTMELDKRDSHEIAEPRLTTFQPRDYGFVPGRKDTLDFDLDGDFRLSQGPRFFDPRSSLAKDQRMTLNRHEAQRPTLVTMEEENEDDTDVVIEEFLERQKNTEQTSELLAIEPVIASDLKSLPGRRTSFSSTPIPNRRSIAAKGKRVSFSLTASKPMRSECPQQRFSVHVPNVSHLSRPTTIHAPIPEKVMRRESLMTSSFMDSHHLTLRDFIKLIEIDCDVDAYQRLSLLDTGGLIMFPFRNPAVSFNEQLKYVTETLIEEQFLREFNASLNRRYKELCLQNRDKEIAFVQKNPFVIDTLLQSDETAHVVKLNLRADFEKCKVIGKQQWKSFKLQREAKRLQLLREIKAALKSDNELLKETKRLAQSVSELCTESNHRFEIQKIDLQRKNIELQELEEKRRQYQKSIQEAIDKRNRLLVAKKKTVERQQRKSALQETLQKLAASQLKSKEEAKQRQNEIDRVLDVQDHNDFLCRIQPFRVRNVIEEFETFSVQLQVEKVFLVEMRYSKTKTMGPPMRITMRLASKAVFSEIFDPNYGEELMNITANAVGISPGSSHERSIYGPHQISEIWTKLHSVRCFIDELYELRLKGPPFVGSSFCDDTLNLKFCNSFINTLVFIQFKFRSLTCPCRFDVRLLNVTVLEGDPNLALTIRSALSCLVPGSSILRRVVDTVNM